ncbi:polysaccharide lyase family 8 super-sandwich domain-containing protein [Massilia sp. Root418]|uniref:polysaccharide lyase family 8 super-sandwich domain-containing protein n=1 Tax=Massilia sp. Root418 TaxID=1736532 RepID=UPI0009E6B0E8|nr:polysaccharide lyase family 8 super-sandwich domain-containing protein [Massilia sp. Root418]
MNLAFRPPRRGLLLALLLHAGLSAAPARADVYDDMRTKWLNRSASAPALAPDDPDVAMQAAGSSAAATQYWSTMNLASNRAALWPDLPLGAVSASVTASVSRLGTLMAAYKSAASPYYQNADVLQAALEGLDWLLANGYSATGTGYDNWWDWQIGVPANLNNFMMANYSLMSPERIAACIASIDHYAPDPTRRAGMDGSIAANAIEEVGANRLDKALGAVMRGILGKSGAKIAAGRDAIPAALAYVTTGDGYYTDGSFIQHTHTPYVGAYGTVLLADISKLYYLLNDSPWSISADPNYLNPYDWAMNAYRPFIFDGAMMDNQRGRSISREGTSDHLSGRATISALAELAQVLPAAQALQLKSVIKGWVERDGSFGESYFTPQYGSGVAVFDIALIKAILNDASIPSAPEDSETRVFPSADRAVSRRDGYAFALSMFSKRISAFEFGNGENKNGWWTGIGMTQLYNADQTQYANTFWPTVDLRRLPGTTTDRSGGTPVAWKHYGNTKNAIGGAELNREFATAAMEFALTNTTASTLSGKKAWFMFGDRIVAVGSGITSTDGVPVETIVENRLLNGAGDNQLTVNDAANTKPATLGWTEAMPATRWAHLAGNTSYGSDIGYVFPDLPAVAALRETRNGAWRNINDGGSTATVSNNFLSLALNHGANPVNAAYTYILLPNRSAGETAAFAAANPISVIERSTTATAVRDNAQGVTGVVYWFDASKTVNVAGQPYLTSDKRSVVTLRQAGGELELAVADPTQLNTGLINLELNRSGNLVSKDDAIAFLNPGGATIKLAVSVNGSLGKSFKAKFALTNKTALAPAADAYARDGSYAGTNYGAAATMAVKQETVSYTRKALLKFDLSAITGTVTSAKLKLTPTSVGMAGVTHNLYQAADSNWTEGAVTWNSMPANGALLGSWEVPAAGTPIEMDVTAAAGSAMGGSKVLSLKVEGAANYGSASSVEYATKENGNANYRPTLVITYQ